MFAFTLIASLAFVKKVYAVNFEFKSQLDKFNIEVDEDQVYFNNQLVNEEPFNFIQPLFESKLLEPCPAQLGNPDLTISRGDGKNAQNDKRIVYIKTRTVSDGTHCADIKGHGVYSLPLHRNWFTGLKKSTIQIKNSFRIVKDDQVIVEYEKTPLGWRSRDPLFFTNWVFFEKFMSALDRFPISYRVHEDAIKASTTFELIENDKKFLFAKVGTKTWAVKMPNSLWLTASSNFGIFEDMSQTIWISPYDKTLRMISDPTVNANKRSQAIFNLADNLSPDVKYAFHALLLKEGEDLNIRKKIVSILRNYPSDENFKVLVFALHTSKEPSFLSLVTKTLRVRNPKGPVVQNDDTAEDTEKKISFWKKWSQSLK